MKKQQLGKKLALKKSKISDLENSQLRGGMWTFNCPPNTLGCPTIGNDCGTPSAACATVNGASCRPTLCVTALSCAC